VTNGALLAAVLGISTIVSGCITDTIEGAQFYVTNHSSAERIIIFSSRQELSGVASSIAVRLSGDSTQERASPLLSMSPEPDATARIDVYDSMCNLVTSLEVTGLGRYRLEVSVSGASVERYSDAPADVATLPVSTETCGG